MYPATDIGPVMTAVQATALRTQLEASDLREIALGDQLRAIESERNALRDQLHAAEAERDALREVTHEAATRLYHLAFTEIRDENGRLTNAERLYGLVFHGSREIGHNLRRYLRTTRRPSARSRAVSPHTALTRSHHD